MPNNELIYTNIPFEYGKGFKELREEKYLGLNCKVVRTVVNSNTIDVWYTNDLAFRGTPQTWAGVPDGLVLPLGSDAVSVAYGTENLGDAAMIWNEDQLICALYASLARRADEIWVKDVKMPPDGGENTNLP